MRSRREFFRSWASDVALELARGARSVDAAAPVVRPPGAPPEADFLAACTRCGDCFPACPRDAIRLAGEELGPGWEGSPVLILDDAPCWLCADLPCVRACEAGALRPLDRAADARLGTVRVHAERCFSALGSPCDVCVERCPVRPRPIAVGTGRAPAIDREACTGCGVCAWLCPARALEVRAPAPVLSRRGS